MPHIPIKISIKQEQEPKQEPNIKPYDTTVPIKYIPVKLILSFYLGGSGYQTASSYRGIKQLLSWLTADDLYPIEPAPIRLDGRSIGTSSALCSPMNKHLQILLTRRSKGYDVKSNICKQHERMLAYILEIMYNDYIR